MSVEYGVAIVGGGPVGMLLAAELTLQGVRPVVLERLPEPTWQSKAGTLHARTAQMLERRGLLDAVGGIGGRRVDRRPPDRPFAFHFGLMFDLDLAKLDLEGPAHVGAPQAWAEHVFFERATSLGAEVRRGHELVGLDDRGDHVALEIAGPDGRYTLTASWVVGADGARSATRKLAGIPFAGKGATVAALMGDVRLLDPYDVPWGWTRTPRGWVQFYVHPAGLSRVSTYDWSGPHADRRAPVTLDELRASVERIAGFPVRMTDPAQLTRYGDAALQAEVYRKGRVLLAGDAAHVHFPAGGQGVNTGLQDAFNLGWKLAAEVNGWAPPGLLDTYHSERHPVAARVLWNVSAQMALMNPDPSVDPLRELFTDLMHLDEVNAYLGNMISGLDIRYDVGVPGAGHLAPNAALKVGDQTHRLADLLRPAFPILLDLADRPDLRDAAAPWSERVAIVTAVSESPLGADALLIRPDGHVAWLGDRPSRLQAALTRWFGTP
ncbi:FAD-dependent monooxygenase [Bailinhaonella thermotolerans]|uniref:Polyketide oxidase n=1 Tax=Bailinhaonella thermotolerans TaxID=1070861 RepID=A0A3A4ACV8_9ACTN|nr:FAD-dependent monooxygenase [Bailinhaonella thermotolerans]RJL24434.1 polyketide oxidase [Bailinhaonella thermotolerans]